MTRRTRILLAFPLAGLVLALAGVVQAVNHSGVSGFTAGDRDCAVAIADLPHNDITFIHISDTHIRDGTTDDRRAFNEALRRHIDTINALPGLTIPGGLPVGTPRGVVHTGDSLDAGSRALCWEIFVEEFGLTGTEGRLNFPVYEGYGNHDQDSFYAQIVQRISARNPDRPDLAAVSGTYQYTTTYGGIEVTGVHYAVQWGPVHMVQLNMRAGDDPLRYPAAGSLTFLRGYLEEVVGESGQPVFIGHHLPPGISTNEWSAEDFNTYMELIADYNVMGILYGHHGGRFTPGSVQGINTFKSDHITGDASTWGATVFRIVASEEDPDRGTLTVAAYNLGSKTWGQVLTFPITGLATSTTRVTLQADPPQGGQTSGAGEFPVGAETAIGAQESTHWYFTGWQDGATDNPRTIVEVVLSHKRRIHTLRIPPTRRPERL